ncbi:lactosylceramide 4-alpha-galactosyltransferase [Rhipicephalus sanguineus]|uniref:lactosylceramide 4-alpha-galactosyltransferase n=1 Tax=Rhipicephalus sanguineus TaxID=34632 RepID=UPI00189478CC|nr:lactosylceramide 4-alpha-galactosyltransferase [Rhipicephalus sanguineus]
MGAQENTKNPRTAVKTTYGSWKHPIKVRLTAREACSIESACRHNRNHTVHLLSTGNISSRGCPYHRLVSQLPNFQSSVLNASAELAGTPLAPLHAEGGALHRSPYVAVHLSDFLRYVVLWNRGGVYLDTDVIVMKSLKGFSNGAFYQSRNDSDSVANGILFFDKQSTVLEALIAKCARVYSPWRWTSCGLALISALAFDSAYSRRLNLFNESVFFAVPHRKWETLFEPESAPEVLRAINGSYGVHFWNDLSKHRRVVTGSGSAMDVLARTHCPFVYKLASLEGHF